MADRPIIFSGPMVRAQINGLKTQTRRLETSPLAKVQVGDRLYVRESWQTGMTGNGPQIAYAATPDCVEIDAWDGHNEGCGPSFNYDRCPGAKWHHWLGDVLAAGPWRPSIHMPRWASRLTLVVTDVRLQHLQDITEEDARAEGMQEPTLRDLGGELEQAAWSERQVFSRLWSSLHTRPGERWEDNPAIVALTFTVHRRNIDAMESTHAA